VDELKKFFFAHDLHQGMRLTTYVDTCWRRFADKPETPKGRLANIFLTFFSCPASETSCERIFSLMRNILTDKRLNMSMENLFCTVQVKLGLEEKKKD
jgi:hypothetical protein